VSFSDNRLLEENRSVYGDKIWRLVESLLDLLGPMENFSHSWLTSDLVDRLRAGMKVGIRLGRSVVNQMQESVDLMISQPSALGLGSSTPMKSAASHSGPNKSSSAASASAGSSKNSTKDTPLSKAIDGVFWIILRVLLNIFIEGGASERETLSENSSPLKAVARLQAFMAWVREGSREYYDLESLYIVTKVTDTLRITKQPPDSPWTRQALSLVSTKLVTQRANIISRLSLLEKSAATDSPATHKRQEFFAYMQRQAPYASLDDSTERLSLDDPWLDPVEKSGVLSLADAIQLQIETMCSDTSGSMNTSAITLETIRLALQLPNDSKFSWPLWSTGMEPILREAQKTEELMLASKLTDMGLHKHSQEMTVLMERQRQIEAAHISSISARVEDSINRVHTAENKHLREAGRNEEQSRKKHVQSWTKILEELANERGPWGSGADEFVDVSDFICFLI
jgi:hypothetical protein